MVLIRSLFSLAILMVLWSVTFAFTFFPSCKSSVGAATRYHYNFLLYARPSEDEISQSRNGTNGGTLTLAKRNDTSAVALQTQAAKLRAEIASIENDLRAQKEAKRQKELADIDRWIEECLYVSVGTSDGSSARIELLNSVDKAAQVLRDNRFSHEQVSKMFERICDTSPAQSRSNCSPLLALLVDAAGKLDCVDRDENPNKRWDGKVERDLRKRLFAMDWNIQMEPFREKTDRFL